MNNFVKTKNAPLDLKCKIIHHIFFGRGAPKKGGFRPYLISVGNASNGVSVKFSMWEEFFLNEREKDSCVILYTVTVCYFTHSVQFYMQCEIVHTVCNFMYSV